MGDVIPFPRIRSASEGLQAALRELDEAMAELMAACADRDRLLADMLPDEAAEWCDRTLKAARLAERMSPAEVKLRGELAE